jgi:hypothetical protein
MNNKYIIVIVLVILGFGVVCLYKFNEKSKEDQKQTQEKRNREIADSLNVVYRKDSLRLSHITDSIKSENEKLKEVVDSTLGLLNNDAHIYEELHSFDNRITLKSRRFNIENLEKWIRVSPNSRTVINIDYDNDIENLLFFSVTGADKIKGIKTLINKATVNFAQKIITKDRRVKAIAELFNQSDFLQDVEVLDTKTNVDRTISIYFTDRTTAYKWKSGESSQFAPFQLFEKRSQCKQFLKRRQIPEGGFSICIENTSEGSDVDFAIQVIGIKSKTPAKKLDNFLSMKQSVPSIEPNPSADREQKIVDEQKEESKVEQIPLFDCKPYENWIGNYFGVQISANADCEIAAQTKNRFKELTDKLPYMIKSKTKMKTPYLVIYGNFSTKEEADTYAEQIRSKIPEFKDAFVTKYADHQNK